MREGGIGRWRPQQQPQPQLAQGEQGWQQMPQHSQHQEGKKYCGSTDRRHLARRRSGRPPPAPSDPCCQAVPLWEKKFCIDECLIPWRKVCEAKKVMFMYTNVMDWNDSAGEEVLNEAKRRYWAKINGLPCDIPLPDPDMYIDIVDQDTHIDPELVEDLDKQPVVIDDDTSVMSSGWNYIPYADIPIPVTGWGNEEDMVQATGWEDTNDPGAVTGCGYAEYSVPFTRWGVTQVPVTRREEDSVPVTGWGNAGDVIPTTAWGYSGYPEYPVPGDGWNNEYSVPVTGWEDGEDTCPVGWDGFKEYLAGNSTAQPQAVIAKSIHNDVDKHMNYDIREIRFNEQVVHGTPRDNRKDKPWNHPKGYVNERRGRHDKKRNGAQFGSRCGHPRFQEDAHQENFSRLRRTT